MNNKKEKKTLQELQDEQTQDIIFDYTMGMFPKEKEKANQINDWDNETPEEKTARKAEEPGWWNI